MHLTVNVVGKLGEREGGRKEMEKLAIGSFVVGSNAIGTVFRGYDQERDWPIG